MRIQYLVIALLVSAFMWIGIFDTSRFAYHEASYELAIHHITPEPNRAVARLSEHRTLS